MAFDQPTSARFRLVIFDWDGTLMDSTGQIVRCLQLAADDVGIVRPSDYDAAQIIGLALPEALARLWPDEAGAIRERVREQYAHHYIKGTGGHSRLFDHAEELLATLQEQGRLLAIATGKNRPGLSRVLDQTGIGHRFHATRCADEARGKPHPEMLLQLLHELRVAPEEAVMIGDTSFDMEMAANAGMARIGLRHGAHAPEQLTVWEPLHLVDDLQQLAVCLRCE